MPIEAKHMAISLVSAALLSACTTVKMPNIDVPGLPEFKKAAAKLIEGFPEVSSAPVRPKDLRSSSDWDVAAKTLLTQRDAFIVPEKGNMPETPEAVASEIEALKAQVHAYKLDDPQ